MNLNEESRTKLGVALMVAISMSIITILGLSLANNRDTTLDCNDKKKNLEIVADITNATGVYPDGRRLKEGERVSVDPNMCKVTFTKPSTSQLSAKRFQGTDSDLQTTLNPQK